MMDVAWFACSARRAIDAGSRPSISRGVAAWLAALAFIVPAALGWTTAAAQSDAAPMAAWMALARTQDSVAGPREGTLLLESGTVHIASTGLDLANFYAHARFANPYAASAQVWDVGFVFHDAGGDDHLRLIIDSDATWRLTSGTGTTLDQGDVPVVATGAGDVNVLDLVVVDDVGYLSVNGEYAASFDLARGGSGDVSIGAGFFAEDKIDGTSSDYAGFEVWALPESTDGQNIGDNLPALQSSMEAARRG